MKETHLGNYTFSINLTNFSFPIIYLQTFQLYFILRREMLDGAQRMIADLKADPNKKAKSGLDEARSREVISKIQLFVYNLNWVAYFLLNRLKII